MLWIINGLIYGFFMALYTIVNQKQRINGYVLGVWRGLGIAAVFAPWLMAVPLPSEAYNWGILTLQGILIGVYDSHIFFASARFGGVLTSKLLVLSVLLTMFAWWTITPTKLEFMLQKPELFMTLLLCISGFCICYWFMMKSRVSRQALFYMTPAIIALAAMSILTKEIALMGHNVWSNIIYYMTISTFISGIYNLVCLLITKKNSIKVTDLLLAPKVIKTGVYIVGFSCALIAAKMLAMRLAPNPAYVVTLLLTAPIFVQLLDDGHKYNHDDDRAGFSMIFFLILLMIVTAGGFGITD